MFKKINFDQFNENPFTLFKKDYALITVGTMDNHNTMTVGWGALGVLWRDEIAIAYVKPTRYTFEFMNSTSHFVFAWFDDSEKSKEILKFCGTKSGRDYDKDHECGLTPFELDSGIAYEEARLLIVCEIIYEDQFKEENMIDKDIMSIYPDSKLHHRYIGKIKGIYVKE